MVPYITPPAEKWAILDFEPKLFYLGVRKNAKFFLAGEIEWKGRPEGYGIQKSGFWASKIDHDSDRINALIDQHQSRSPIQLKGLQSLPRRSSKCIRPIRLGQNVFWF
jgi:hypothetical protein